MVVRLQLCSAAMVATAAQRPVHAMLPVHHGGMQLSRCIETAVRQSLLQAICNIRAQSLQDLQNGEFAASAVSALTEQLLGASSTDCPGPVHYGLGYDWEVECYRVEAYSTFHVGYCKTSLHHCNAASSPALRCARIVMLIAFLELERYAPKEDAMAAPSAQSHRVLVHLHRHEDHS